MYCRHPHPPVADATGPSPSHKGEGLLRRFAERLVALLPIARAKLIGLQRVENAQHLGRVTPDRKIVHAGETDDAFGIDQEGPRAGRHVRSGP